MIAVILLAVFLILPPESHADIDGRCGLGRPVVCPEDPAPPREDPVAPGHPQDAGRPALAPDPNPGIDNSPKREPKKAAGQNPNENTYDLGGKNGGNSGKLPGAQGGDVDTSLLWDKEGVAAPRVDFSFGGGTGSAR